MSHAHAVAGLPPARPSRPPVLFVYALTHDDVSTDESPGRPRAHNQLGAWYGKRSYEGIVLSFFRKVPDARASFKTLAWLYGGQRIRNVVATWDQQARPSRSLRNTVFGCLQAKGSGRPGGSRRPPPRARLGTFVGYWGGHDRGLSIKPSGRGDERGNSGCCSPIYQMRFQILSVRGTLTRATALYRVASFRRYYSGVRKLSVGQIGKLRLRNGIVTNTLTQDFFCSNPAWGATNACGL